MKLCISSDVEEPSLKSKRIWDVVSQVFQTIFQLDLVNSYGALHHFVVTWCQNTKKKEREGDFLYWYSGELKTTATVAADMDCLFNSFNLFSLMKHQKIGGSSN